MKRFTVVCIGYKNPDIDKIRELLYSEELWLESQKLGRKIIIHPGICLKRTENYNPDILRFYEEKKYVEYNLSAADLNTKYNCNAKHEYKMCI